LECYTPRLRHRKLLRVLLSQGVPQAWVGLTHELLVDRCTFLGDTPVPTQRGTRREGGELAKYGVIFRQCALSGRFQPWDNRHGQPCPHCHGPYKFGDPCHWLVCAGAPPAFAAARSGALGRVAALEARGGPVKLLCNLLVGESTQVPALRSVSPAGASPPWVLGAVRTLAVGLSTRDCRVPVKKVFKLAKVVPD
jgi:hypothetical protein